MPATTVYFEFIKQGAYVKVIAVDASDGLEVSIVGAAGVPQAELQRLVLRKLQIARKKQDARPKGQIKRNGPGTLA